MVVSTGRMNRAVADVYACRKDFYDANKPLVEKFVAGYLKACEDVAALRKEFLEKKASPRYMAVLKLAQDIYGKEVLPTLEVDADGLIADAEFVFLPGNKLFFEVAGNRVGFAEKEKTALDLAVNQGYAKVRAAFFAPKLDYDKIASLGKLTNTKLDLSRFTAEIHGRQLRRSGQGHRPGTPSTRLPFTSSPTNTTSRRRSMARSSSRWWTRRPASATRWWWSSGTAIRRRRWATWCRAAWPRAFSPACEGAGGVRYFLNQQPLDLTKTEQIVQLIEKGAFSGAKPDPRATMTAGLEPLEGTGRSGEGGHRRLSPSRRVPAGRRADCAHRRRHFQGR